MKKSQTIAPNRFTIPHLIFLWAACNQIEKLPLQHLHPKNQEEWQVRQINTNYQPRLQS
jgi:hypothetical protein